MPLAGPHQTGRETEAGERRGVPVSEPGLIHAVGAHISAEQRAGGLPVDCGATRGQVRRMWRGRHSDGCGPAP